MTEILAPAFLTLSAVILVWDILLAGSISQVRDTPPGFAALTALSGLLIAPAVLIVVASSSILTGRAIYVLAWVWPATLLVFAAQAAYTAARHMVTPLISLPIAVYNLLLAVTAFVRLYVFRGGEPADPLLALLATQAMVVGSVAGPAALSSPLWLQVPLLSPAFPARWRGSAAVRTGFAVVAALSVALTLLELPKGFAAVQTYDRYRTARLTERPQGDFAIGLRVFPTLHGSPAPLALRGDLALVDTLQVGAVSVLIAPEAARGADLDSIARALEPFRRDSLPLVVTLGYPRDAVRRFASGPSAYTQERLEDVRRIAQRLAPSYVLPVLDPYGAGARALGELPVDYWKAYLVSAADVVHRVNRRIRVGVSASSFTASDSALFAWAADRDSPVDVVGFTLFPTVRGALGLDARLLAADRWMRVARSPKDHWVFAAGGYPMAHGEQSQERALWAVLAWATSHPPIKGVIVDGAGDYSAMTGLRAPGGRVRRALTTVSRALRGLRENSAL